MTSSGIWNSAGKLRGRAVLRVATSHPGIYPPHVLANLRGVPTILRSGPYRLYFHSHEANEPRHIHVDRDEATAKFW